MFSENYVNMFTENCLLYIHINIYLFIVNVLCTIKIQGLLLFVCVSLTVAAFFKDHYRPWTVTVKLLSCVKWFTSSFFRLKIKIHVALIEDMKGDCLAYVACCSLELATESFQVYQQCKKQIKIYQQSKMFCAFYDLYFKLYTTSSIKHDI